MRRTIEFVLIVAFALFVPAWSQNTGASSASRVVGSGGTQPQSSASKFVGGLNSGESAWGAGNGSFGAHRAATGTQSAPMNSNGVNGKTGSATTPAKQNGTKSSGLQTASATTPVPNKVTAKSALSSQQKTTTAAVAGRSPAVKHRGAPGTQVSSNRRSEMERKARRSRTLDSFGASSSLPKKPSSSPVPPFGNSEELFGQTKP